MDIREEKIISIAEKIYNESMGKIDILDILNELDSKKIQLDYNIFKTIRNKFYRYENNKLEMPALISNFIIKYLSDKRVANILDPCVNIGSLLSPLITKYDPKFSLGVDENSKNIEIAELLNKKKNTKFVLSKPEKYLLNMYSSKKLFDVIVCCIPYMRYMKNINDIPLDKTQKRTKDKLVDFGFFIMFFSSFLLSRNGVAFFIIPDAFLSALNNFFHKDIYVNAVFSLPINVVKSTGSPYLSLVAFSQQKTENIFVAELNQNINQEALLENLKKRKEGRIESLGFLVKQNELDCYIRLLNKRELKRVAVRYDLKEVKISKELTSDINLSSKKNKDGFIIKPNSIFMPLIGNSNTVTSIEEFKLKPHNYIQLVIREEMALAEYVSLYLNSAMGKMYRENLTSGTVIPKISKGAIAESSIYLPDMEKQRDVINVQKNVTNVFNRISAINKIFLSNPFNTKRIEKDLKPFSKLDSFENWVDDLPFPLASILINYDRANNIHYQLNHLYNFFEALTQYNTILMLSAYNSDKKFFEEHKNEWLEKNKSYKYFEHSTFGSWLTIAERLAKFTRQELNEETIKKEMLFELFRTKRISFIESLANKELFKVLKEVKELRNRRAHGGVETPEIDKQNLARLETKLSKIRKIIHNYDGINLVKPGSCEISEGIYRYKITNLMGSRNIFKEQECNLIVPMDKNSLFLLDENNAVPLELLPFIKFAESPYREKNACYFYNHINKEGVHWVSYHFKKENEITEKDQSFENYLKILLMG